MALCGNTAIFCGKNIDLKEPKHRMSTNFSIRIEKRICLLHQETLNSRKYKNSFLFGFSLTPPQEMFVPTRDLVMARESSPTPRQPAVAFQKNGELPDEMGTASVLAIFVKIRN